jgi:hypothetical protein
MTLVLPLVAVLAGSCASQPAAPAAPPAPPAPPYSTTATLKDIMQLMVDPAADQVWQAVMTVDSAKGKVERCRGATRTGPWRVGAVTLLRPRTLMIPGRRAPGEKSEAPGVELEAAAMGALIESDLASYYKSAQGLHDAALLALQAIDAKNAEKLFEVGETIELACEHCHSNYWYPNEKIPAFPTTLTTEPPSNETLASRPQEFENRRSLTDDGVPDLRQISHLHVGRVRLETRLRLVRVEHRVLPAKDR